MEGRAAGMMSRDDVARLMDEMHSEEQQVRGEGQKEYAHDESNALANFEDGAKITGISREQALFLLLHKHIRGIAAYVQGHRSQREDIRGRIKDARVYLALLRAMVEDDAKRLEKDELGAWDGT